MSIEYARIAASAVAFVSAAAVYIGRPTADAALVALVLAFAGCTVAGGSL
jgi:hypothetical protein